MVQLFVLEDTKLKVDKYHLMRFHQKLICIKKKKNSTKNQ